MKFWFLFFFFFKQKTAYEIRLSLVGSEMCIRDRYWVSASPSRVGVGTAWFLGLFLDVLEGSVLGINGLGLVLVAYFASSQHRRFRMLRPLQQACTVVIVIALYLTLLQWLRVINGESIYNGFSYLFGSLTSGLLWPLFVYLFSFTRPRTAR